MRPRYLVAFLTLLALPLFVANLGCLSLKLDDWCVFNSYASMLRSGLPSTLHRIVNNEYIHGWVRIQFVSFVIKLFAYLAFGYRYIPHFLLQFAFHVAVAATLFGILARYDERLALYSALFFLVMPTGQGVLFWVNMLFQIASLLFYLAYLYRLLNPLRRRSLDLWALTGWFTLAQFAGEQTLALLYATPCALLLASLVPRASTPRLLRDRVRLGLPAAAGALLLIVYLASVAAKTSDRPAGQTRLPGALDPRLFTKAVSGCARAIVYSLDGRSWYYARLSIPPSRRTLATTAASAAVFLAGLLLLRRRAAPSRIGRARLAAFVAACAVAGAVLLWVPVAYGIMTAMRPMQTRYLYGFGIPLALLAALPLASLPRRYVLFEYVVALLIFSYLAFLDCYALNELWRSQKEHDRKVWAAADSQIRRGCTHLLFVDVKKWWCSAVPDFAQPFGIEAYLAAHYPQPITFDLDALGEGRRGERTAVIKVSRPPRRPVSDPLITVYPSYGDYLRSVPGG